jgi:phosphotransferase system HPr-like phosphotransfer protein
MRVERLLVIERAWTIQDMAWFVNMARGVDNPVTLEHRNSTANGKGLLGVVSLMMHVQPGESVRLVVTGSRSTEAMTVLLDQLPVGVIVKPLTEKEGILL